MTEAELSPIKRALLEQRRLKARIEELERARTEPIAVIGVGCRFPGASGPVAFWQLLENGVDAISDMPASRWDVSKVYDIDPEAPGKIATRFGGYLDQIDQFDPHAFGISPREAETMDPQQRVLLEVTWETLEHAGCAVDRLSGSSTGVFVGIGPCDYSHRYAMRGSVDEIDPYLATGNAHSVASGRISYLLGLHGPSISVDTACSSSLVAIHLAVESIRSGSCTQAIAGGVGILLGDQNYISLSKARMMAKDGRCKTFDARADGFVRSEGCGMVMLKKLSDAQANGDRILAVIRGTACNQDGRSNGITAPNGPAQQAVIRAALANAGAAPSSIGYVEAHGTGTVLGDPIEVESLTGVLGEGRADGQPLLLGSVKTNMGHLEGAAGVAGFIKTVLALHHKSIPANLHFDTPNPIIGWDSYRYLKIPTALTPWQDGPRLAGVSAFGFSGTNAHVVLEEAPVAAIERPAADRPLHILALSAKTPAALRVAAAELAKRFDGSRDDLADICYSVNTGRAGLSNRAVIVARSSSDVRSRLLAIASGRTDAGVRSGVAEEGAAPRVLFVFPGDDAPYAEMAKQLYDTQPTFRRAIDECDAALQPGDARPTQFAMQYALVELWKSWGVTPDAVLGQGTGALAAATAAGVLRLEDAMQLALGRGSNVPTAAPQIPLYSSNTGRRATPAESASELASSGDAGMRDAAIASAARDGFAAVVEMGHTDWHTLSNSISELFIRGAQIDWRGFDRGYGRSRVEVPSSPFMRERYWFVERSLTPTAAVAAPASVAPPAAAPSAPTFNLRDRLLTLTHGERKEIAQELVQRQVVKVLRLRPDAPLPGMNDRLMNIGMDSLMAVDLQKQLHKELESSVKLPSTLIFDHPTISAIADLVLTLLGFDNVVVAEPVVAVSAPAYDAAAVAAIADLTDEEVEAMLSDRLKEF